MVNRLRLTLQHFHEIIKLLAIQNNFVMSFHDNFSQSNKLDTKNQRANSTEKKFPMVNRKIRKKGYSGIHLFLSING